MKRHSFEFYKIKPKDMKNATSCFRTIRCKWPSFLAIAAFFLCDFQKVEAQDVGATVLVDPYSTVCAATNQNVTVAIKNYDTQTIDFAINSVTITVNITGASTQTFNTTLSNGTLAAGATQNVIVATTSNLSTSGTHIFNAFTTLGGDINSSNDSMPVSNVTVNPIPVVTATPSSQTICSGTSPTIVISSNIPGTTFSKTYVENGVSGADDWTEISTQILTATGTTNGTVVYTIYSTANGCSGSPISVTITVKPSPIPTITSSSQSICSGSSTSIALTSSTPGTTFSWTVLNQTGIIGASADSGSTIAQTLTLTGTTPGEVIYSITCTANGCIGSSISDTASVNPLPIATATPSSQTICSWGTTPIALSSNIIGTTFFWTVAQTGVTGASPGNGSIIAQTLSCTGITPGTAVYTITPSANGCVGVPITVTITIKPTPYATATPSSQTICSGDSPSIVLTSNIPGTTFSWTVVQNGVSGANNFSLINSQILTTTTSSSGTVVYKITPSFNGCYGTQITVTLTVEPLPAATATPSSQTICSGGTTSIILSCNPPGTSLSWTAIQTGVTGASAGTGVAIAQILTCTGNISGTTIYTISANSYSCAGNTINDTVTVNFADYFYYSSATYCQTGTNPTPTFYTSGGVFSSTPAGLSIDSLTGTINLASSSIGTYSITYTSNSPCTGSSENVTINGQPLADFTYSGAPYCQNTNNAFPTFGSGASAGIFSAAPVGLVFVNINTGEIDLLLSTPGNYIVTNTIAASGGCAATSATTSLTIDSMDDASFNYASSTYCQLGTNPTPIITGLSGGIFSSSPTGLSIDSLTGTINLAASTLGTYIVTYSTNGNCTNSSSVNITIINAFSANFSYSGSPYCQTANNPFPTFGSGAIAGTFSATPSGLIFINVNTGEIDLITSTPGTYTVTNTISAGGGCIATSATTSLTINSTDDASFNYALTTYCQTGANPTPTITGVPGGKFSASSSGLSIDSLTGTINIATCILGTYTVTYTTNGTCPNASFGNITIATALSANFSYSNSLFCPNANNPTPIFGSGSNAGLFSATSAGLSIDSSTGTITLSTSALGTYTVTNSILGGGGCAATSATANVTVGLDDASFTYSSPTYCQGGGNPIPNYNALPGGTYSATPAGLAINQSTGLINLSNSALGNYSVTYTTNGSCPNTSSVNISIAIAFSATPSSQLICTGGTTSIALTSLVSGTTYTWTVVQTNVSGASSGNGNSIAQTLTSNGINPSIAVYTITSTSNSCSSVSINDTVTVNLLPPVITATPSAQTICSGINGSVALSSDIPGTIFSWTIVQTNTTGASAGTGTVISQPIIATGNTMGTAIYTITPVNSGCVGTSISVTIFVKPIPIVTATPSAQTICSGNACSITLTSNVSGTNFYWSALQIGATGAYYSGGSSIVQNLTATGSIPGKVIYTITPFSNNFCYGTPIIDTITISVRNSSFYYSSATYCQTGANPTPTITGVPGGTFSSSPLGLSINPSTGTVSLATSALGVYTLFYTENAPCTSTSSITMTITSSPSPNFSYSDSLFCKIAGNPSPIFASGASAGFFSATPSGLVFNHVNTGEINLSLSTPGIYTITNTIPASGNCPALTATTVIHINDCFIAGHIFKDNNNNCLMNSGDQGIWYIPVNIYNNNSFIGQTYSYNGYYKFVLGTLGTYSVKIDTSIIPFAVNCNYPGIDSTLLLTGGNPSAPNINFALVCKPGFDIGTIYIYNWGMAFPGLQHELLIFGGDMSQWYNGINCSAGVSGQVQVTVTGPIAFNGPAPGALTPSVSGNVFTYTIADFGTINNSQAFGLLFTTNSNAQAGDQICVNVIVTPTNGDNNINNNTYNYCYQVVNSLDPNQKEVYPINVAPGYQDWFTYTIHFQNTGTASAMNIRLADTLDSNLDFETFQVINYSDTTEVSLDNNILTFNFPNIMLPDSTSDPEGSKGFVQYRIKPKANLPAGTQIKNTAFIYFDYNAPIVTNTTINEFMQTIAINENKSNASLSIFPNPGNGHFTLSIASDFVRINSGNIEIYNVLGEKIYQSEIKNPRSEIDISQQPNGIYILRVNDNGQSLNQRLIKQ